MRHVVYSARYVAISFADEIGESLITTKHCYCVYVYRPGEACGLLESIFQRVVLSAWMLHSAVESNWSLVVCKALPCTSRPSLWCDDINRKHELLQNSLLSLLPLTDVLTESRLDLDGQILAKISLISHLFSLFGLSACIIRREKICIFSCGQRCHSCLCWSDTLMSSRPKMHQGWIHSQRSEAFQDEKVC